MPKQKTVDASFEAEHKFDETVRHMRWNGVYLSDVTHEAVNICGRMSLHQLETLTAAYREWIDATIYKPEG